MVRLVRFGGFSAIVVAWFGFGGCLISWFWWVLLLLCFLGFGVAVRLGFWCTFLWVSVVLVVWC